MACTSRPSPAGRRCSGRSCRDRLHAADRCAGADGAQLHRCAAGADRSRAGTRAALTAHGRRGGVCSAGPVARSPHRTELSDEFRSGHCDRLAAQCPAYSPVPRAARGRLVTPLRQAGGNPFPDRAGYRTCADADRPVSLPSGGSLWCRSKPLRNSAGDLRHHAAGRAGAVSRSYRSWGARLVAGGAIARSVARDCTFLC